MDPKLYQVVIGGELAVRLTARLAKDIERLREYKMSHGHCVQSVY